MPHNSNKATTQTTPSSADVGRVEEIDSRFQNLTSAPRPKRFGLLRVRDSGNVRNLLFGYDDRERKRRILFRPGDCDILQKKNWANTNRVRLSVRDITIRDSTKAFLELAEKKISDPLFTEFVSNVLGAFIELEPEARTGEAFIRCVEARIQKDEQSSFTELKQVGLLGELHVLEKDLVPLLGADAALRAWSGPFRKAKDFDTRTCCIEVKSTKSSKNHTFHVNSESQFVKPEKKPLILVFFVYEALSSGGNTVAERFLEVRKHFTGDLVSQFEDVVRKAGYNHQERDDYKLKSFSFIKRQFFLVEQGFPIVRPEHLYVIVEPGMIQEFEYTVRVGALGKFELKSEADYVDVLQNGVADPAFVSRCDAVGIEKPSPSEKKQMIRFYLQKPIDDKAIDLLERRIMPNPQEIKKVCSVVNEISDGHDVTVNDIKTVIQRIKLHPGGITAADATVLLCIYKSPIRASGVPIGERSKVLQEIYRTSSGETSYRLSLLEAMGFVTESNNGRYIITREGIEYLKKLAAAQKIAKAKASMEGITPR